VVTALGYGTTGLSVGQRVFGLADWYRDGTLGEYVAGFERFVDYWSGPQASSNISADARDAMAARLPKIALEFHATLNEPTRLEDFRSMTVPALLLCGAKSPRPTRRICELLERMLPNAALTTIDDAGHMAPMTHRDQVNAMIVAHLNANSRRVSRRLSIGETLPGRSLESVA